MAMAFKHEESSFVGMFHTIGYIIANYIVCAKTVHSLHGLAVGGRRRTK